jgi:hypothetical protein
MACRTHLGMEDTHPGLTQDELSDQEAADLPDREAMSLLDPGTAMGGVMMPNPPTDTTQPLPPETSGGGTEPISLPRIPLPADNPDGVYTSETSASSQT